MEVVELVSDVTTELVNLVILVVVLETVVELVCGLEEEVVGMTVEAVGIDVEVVNSGMEVGVVVGDDRTEVVVTEIKVVGDTEDDGTRDDVDLNVGVDVSI